MKLHTPSSPIYHSLSLSLPFGAIIYSESKAIPYIAGHNLINFRYNFVDFEAGEGTTQNFPKK